MITEVQTKALIKGVSGAVIGTGIVALAIWFGRSIAGDLEKISKDLENFSELLDKREKTEESFSWQIFESLKRIHEWIPMWGYVEEEQATRVDINFDVRSTTGVTGNYFPKYDGQTAVVYKIKDKKGNHLVTYRMLKLQMEQDDNVALLLQRIDKAIFDFAVEMQLDVSKSEEKI